MILLDTGPRLHTATTVHPEKGTAGPANLHRLWHHFLLHHQSTADPVSGRLVLCAGVYLGVLNTQITILSLRII